MAVAEHKYNLALVETQTEKKIRPQPWYKERLHTKYVKALKPTDIRQHLTGNNWMFVKDGLDDFRDGLPPAVEGSDFIKTEKGPGPTIRGSTGSPSSVNQPAQPNRFSKHQICFSRITALQQQRREHIDEIEYGLLQHPLALYPHLEESVPPEMFEDIVDILDPDMNMVEDEDEIPEENEQDVREEPSNTAADEQQHPPASARSLTESFKSEKGDESTRVRNPYRWLPRKEEKDKEKKDRRSVRERANASSPSEEEHIQKVTREFCQWVADLGGESNNIEESTITSLFASGYETKPALSVPIHVVELTNVPQELRMSASVPQQQQSQSINYKAIPLTDETQKEWKVTGEYEPSWIRFKYGAWYLQPKTWQKRQWDAPLADPKEIKDQEMSEAKKKSQTLNEELSTMHASKAFMDFIGKKSVRKPEFLEEVSEIQRKAAEDEQKRLEAELLAKQIKKSGAAKGSAKP
ncbi:protein FAM47E-like [Littorina saxatilis]|uniref:Uncharacterized protein n=1 Tax=Littorina saxatilis TaxID=31220 RepID=A0AAN9B1R9_9CAEN